MAVPAQEKLNNPLLKNGQLIEGSPTNRGIISHSGPSIEVDQYRDLLRTAELSEADGLIVDATNARARAKLLQDEAAKNAAE